jgi:hypothetical protein
MLPVSGYEGVWDGLVPDFQDAKASNVLEPRSSESESLVLPLNEGAPVQEHLPASRARCAR